MGDMVRPRTALLGIGLLLASVSGASAQGRPEPQPPRTFPEFVGAWVLAPGAGAGHIAGLPVATRLVIATSPTEIIVTKDALPPEHYRIDGKDTVAKSAETGATQDRRYRFTLVAEMLALTSMQPRSRDGQTFTNTITDAYRVSGDVLTVERQLSVLIEPPGHLATLQDAGSNRQTLIYRREPPAPSVR
jgi:hypothetical protein